MKPRPFIAVADVEATSLWYREVLGFQSGHGGNEYEQLLSDGEMVLQLEGAQANGNGVVLWFSTDNFDSAWDRVRSTDAEILEPPKVNPNANHREVWFRDPNGYVIVVAGAYGDV